MTRMLLLLTGGAIINVAVAWGCAAYPDLTQARSSYCHDDFWSGGTINARVTAQVGRRQVGQVTVMETYLRTRTIRRDRPTVQQKANEHLLGYVSAGWPLFSATCELVGKFGMPRAEQTISWGVPLPPHGKKNGNEWRALPYRPLWPGFVINTIFYAAILWLPFGGFRFARLRIRARRGQCPACAYPVGASDVCTECGKTVTRQLAIGNRK